MVDSFYLISVKTLDCLNVFSYTNDKMVPYFLSFTHKQKRTSNMKQFVFVFACYVFA